MSTARTIGLCLLLTGALWACAPHSELTVPTTTAATGGSTYDAQGLLDLSRQKWLWMAERDIDARDALFHEEAVFIHMGGTMTRDQELGIIQSGGIHYKHAEVQAASVRFVGETAVVLNTIGLDAVVGGNEVTNPFEVTEVYVRHGDTWKLATLSFTRLLQ